MRDCASYPHWRSGPEEERTRARSTSRCSRACSSRAMTSSGRSNYPPHILSPPIGPSSSAGLGLGLGLGATFTHEEPSLLSHSFHTAPAAADAMLAPQITPQALARSDRHAALHNHAYDSGHISAALASLSTHADHLRGFMQDEKILSPRSSV